MQMNLSFLFIKVSAATECVTWLAVPTVESALLTVLTATFASVLSASRELFVKRVS